MATYSPQATRTGPPLRAGTGPPSRPLSANRDLARGAWKTITYTLSGGTAVLYEDGVEVARKTGVTITPGSIGAARRPRTTSGRSVYSG